MKMSVKLPKLLLFTLFCVIYSIAITAQNAQQPILPWLEDIYAIEGKQEKVTLTGEELIQHLKDRFSYSNYIGSEDGENEILCAVDFEKNDDYYSILLKDQRASVKSYPISIDEVKSFRLGCQKRYAFIPIKNMSFKK